MLKELGEYKNRLLSIFVNDDKICKLLLGEDYENQEYDLGEELGKYILPHLYIPDVVTDVESYIFFETNGTKFNSTIKNMNIIIQVICHKDAVKYAKKPEGYYGNRYDVMAQYVEELLCPIDKKLKKAIMEKFGIGNIELKITDLFLTNKFVGRTLTFSVPEFR